VTWTLTDAKSRLSELLNLTHFDGPQRIKRRGETVVIITEVEYDHLRGSQPSFKELLLTGPSLDGLDLERDASAMREVTL